MMAKNKICHIRWPLEEATAMLQALKGRLNSFGRAQLHSNQPKTELHKIWATLQFIKNDDPPILCQRHTVRMQPKTASQPNANTFMGILIDHRVATEEGHNLSPDSTKKKEATEKTLSLDLIQTLFFTTVNQNADLIK